MARKEETPGKWPVLVLIVSVLVIVVAGLCTFAGYSVRDNDLFYLIGYLAIGIGLILLVAGGLGLGYSLRRLALARGILPRWLLPLFVGVPVVLLGLLAALYFALGSAPRSAGHLRLQQAMGKHDFAEADLVGADLRGVDLSGVDLSGAYVRGADLREADLSGADLGAANLSEANLQGADLGNANLYGADLHDADLRGANMIGADLRKAWLKTGNLDSTTQIDAKWHLVWSIQQTGGSNRGLRGADLSEANLFLADLSGANLHRADLSGADLIFADLSGADLLQADLSGANLIETDLRGTNLFQADLGAAILTGADLSGADLTGAQVTDEQLAQAWKLEGAIMPDGSVHE